MTNKPNSKRRQSGPEVGSGSKVINDGDTEEVSVDLVNEIKISRQGKDRRL